MEPADLQPLSSYQGCFGSREPWAVTKPSLSLGDRRGAAPKGCSLGFVYFLENRDCFLVQEQVSTPHPGMSGYISFPRHSHTELRVSVSPSHSTCPGCLPPPEPSTLCCCRTNTLHGKTRWRHTITGKGNQKDRSHSPGMGHGKLSPLPAALPSVALGPQAEAPSSRCPSQRSQTAYIFSEPIYLFWD